MRYLYYSLIAMLFYGMAPLFARVGLYGMSPLQAMALRPHPYEFHLYYDS